MNRYEILERIGAGGFGSVYRARVSGVGGFQKLVAVKILRADREADEEVGQRLRDEARMLGLLRHRAVVHADGLVRLGGSWAVVMELVEGTSLRKLLADGPIPLAAAFEICAEVAGALHAAWTATDAEGRPIRLLHRDVKPSNIQVTALGEVKLLDFGIARAEFVAREARTVALHFGTDLYMAPERIEHVYGPEGDVYSLGVVLYNALTGNQLGKAWALAHAHGQMVEEGLADLDETYPHAPSREAVRGLLARTLAWDRAARPTARELERALGDLRLQVGGPGLRDWAEEAVVRVDDTENTGAVDDLVGRVLTEDAPARAPVDEKYTAPTVVLPPRPRTWRLFAPIGCAGALLAASVAVAAAVWVGTEPEPAVELAPAVPVVEAPVEMAPPPPEPTVTAEPTVAAAPVGTPAPPARKEAPKRPKTAPPEPAPSTMTVTTGEVHVAGDAAEVWLLRDGKRARPGTVAAGAWQVEATFAGKDPFVATTVDVPAGGAVTVTCKAALLRCR